MGTTRKPCSLEAKRKGRDYLWEYIRTNKLFTAPQLTQNCDLHICTVREYVKALLNAGYIAISQRPPKPSDPILYKLVRDTPIPPKVGKNGTETNRGRGQENMWRAMRILKHFTLADLVETASSGGVIVAKFSARDYCNRLARAGYLINGGKSGYRIVPARISGPQPPIIQRDKSVYDPNLKKVVWPVKDDK